MVTRSTCLYNGEIIGIETVYTVVEGKQINIPDKVESLRKKGRDGLLSCPCGCGQKLILVAGDRNLREQHFRIKDGSSWSNCTLKQEGENSVDSKIIIKCWLNDKVSNDVETRVQISNIVETDRQYELTHLVRNNKLAINYTNERVNVEDEKLSLLDLYMKDYSIYYIVDIDNYENNNQYPEFMIKIQNKQKYCLFLQIEGRDYSKAKLISAFYGKDINGLYKIIELTNDYLNKYSFIDNQIVYEGKRLIDLFENSNELFKKELEEEKQIKIKQAKIREEEYKRRLIEIQKQEEERQKQLEEYRRQQEIRRKEIEEENRKNREAKQVLEREERRKQEQQESLIKQEVEENIDSYIDEPYEDIYGNRWYKCKCCGKVGKIKDFGIFGGVHEAARGTCHDCIKNSSNKIDFELSKVNGSNGNFCPECGSPLIRRTGKYGDFFGCSSYPHCRYTRKI